VSAPNSVTLTLTDHLGTAGADGDWEMIDAVSPVMTEGARKWIRDIAGQFQAAGINASFAFSMAEFESDLEFMSLILGFNGAATSWSRPRLKRVRKLENLTTVEP
jgi:hypothetical protein